MSNSTAQSTTSSADASALAALPRSSGRIPLNKLLFRDKRATAGLILLIIIVFATIFAPLVSSYDPQAQIYDTLAPPSGAHILGTDDLGRDLFARILYGARVSLLVGVVTVAIALVIGVTMGMLSGYYGGWIDTILMRYIDLQWAFPNFIIAVYLVAVFGTGLSNVIVAVSLAFLDDFARITRGMVLTISGGGIRDRSEVAGGIQSAYHVSAHPSQCRRADHRPGDSKRLLRYPGRSRTFVPGAWCATYDAHLGLNCQRFPKFLLPRMVVGDISRAGDHGHRTEHQFFGRCSARYS